MSIIPKPGRPGKFRVVQNFSFSKSPTPTSPNSLINSCVNTNIYLPHLLGQFAIVYLLISCLSPGSEAATHDVAVTYHTIPLHESQWPSAVVRTKHDQFYVNTYVTFGAAPSSGIYGHITNAGAEILRSQGIRPLDKWVNDHIFLHIRHTFITDLQHCMY
jgi:hypothetical protein